MTISSNLADEFDYEQVLLGTALRVAELRCTPVEVARIRLALKAPSEFVQGFIDGNCEAMDETLNNGIANLLNSILYPQDFEEQG